MKTLIAAAALLLSVPPAADPDWGMFRGPNRDGHSPDTGLLKQWPAGGPALAWKATGLGKGASSLSIHGDKMYTLGDLADGCHLICLNVADGKIAWTTKMGAPWVDEKWLHGPRGTPATDGTLVIGLSPNGDLLCADAATGKEKWKKSMKGDFGGKMMSGWGFSESPLLDGENVVITPGSGSKGTVAALKKATGELVWQSSDLTDSAAYASLVPVEIGGVRQYLLLTDANVAGIAAKDGKVLWRAARAGKTAVIPTPVYKDGIVFVTSGYGIGCNAFKITESGGKFSAAEIYAGKQMMNHHGGVILIGDYIYGLDDRALKCIELKTGKVVWENASVGKGSVAFADGHLVLRGENEKKGEIALAEATPEGYKETGRFTQPDLSGKKCWAHPVVFGGKMYIRDHDLLLCYDVKAK